jgi:integrase
LDPNEEYLFIDRDIVYERHRQDDFKLYRKNYYDYWQDLHKTCEMVGVDPKKFSTHDWRRNFANKIWTDVLNKKDIEALRRALGHAHIDTTVRYLRHSGMESQDVFKKSFDLEK